MGIFMKNFCLVNLCSLNFALPESKFNKIKNNVQIQIFSKVPG